MYLEGPRKALLEYHLLIGQSCDTVLLDKHGRAFDSSVFSTLSFPELDAQPRWPCSEPHNLPQDLCDRKAICIGCGRTICQRSCHGHGSQPQAMA